MNTYQINCPNCQQSFAANDELAGSQTQCQFCQSYFTIPNQVQAMSLTQNSQPAFATPVVTDQVPLQAPEVPLWYKRLTIMGPLFALLLLLGGGTVYWIFNNSTETKITNTHETQIIKKELPPITPYLDAPQTGGEAGDLLVIDLGNGVTMAFRWCPAGEFMMGDNKGENDETLHHVRLSKGFWIAETETTQAQWQQLMVTNVKEQWQMRENSYQKSSWKEPDINPALPMNFISWEESQAAVTRLNQYFKSDLHPVSLPTEAQWEYACKAGKSKNESEQFDIYHYESFGKQKANYNNHSQGVSTAGSYPANTWGIYDMNGNLWEWCADWYSRDSYGNNDEITIDPQGAAKHESRDYPKIRVNISDADKRRASEIAKKITSLETLVSDYRTKSRQEKNSMRAQMTKLSKDRKTNSDEFKMLIRRYHEYRKQRAIKHSEYRANLKDIEELENERKLKFNSPSKVCRGGTFYYGDARAANRNHDLMTDRSIATGLRFVLNVADQPPATYAKLPPLDQRKPGDKYTIEFANQTSITFCWIPAGSFIMGEADPAMQAFDNRAHPVALTKGFWMAETECTQEQADALTDALYGRKHQKNSTSQHPYTGNSWYLLSGGNKYLKTRIFPKNLKLRLPTEAEWEYACRAGTTTPYNIGDALTPTQANIAATVTEKNTIQPVKQYAPNPWGLHDMHGNVWEACDNYYAADAYQVLDGKNLLNEKRGQIVIRGGAYSSDPWMCRSAFRSKAKKYIRYPHVGVRIVMYEEDMEE